MLHSCIPSLMVPRRTRQRQPLLRLSSGAITTPMTYRERRRRPLYVNLFPRDLMHDGFNDIMMTCVVLENRRLFIFGIQCSATTLDKDLVSYNQRVLCVPCNLSTYTATNPRHYCPRDLSSSLSPLPPPPYSSSPLLRLEMISIITHSSVLPIPSS